MHVTQGAVFEALRRGVDLDIEPCQFRNDQRRIEYFQKPVVDRGGETFRIGQPAFHFEAADAMQP